MELVEFEIYCCDWTWMNIQIKKQILLIMQLNNAMHLKMKVTPTKYIGLPMFCAVCIRKKR